MKIDEAVALIHTPLLEWDQPQSWCDLGSGRGTFTRALAQLLAPGSTVYAVDFDANALEEIPDLHKDVEIRKIVGDIESATLRLLPIDVQNSDWFCTLEKLSEDDRKKYVGPFAVRMGLRYVKGLRKKTGQAIEVARHMDGPFASEYDLRRRLPSMKKAELTLLATAGAFNWTGEKHHRRAALWHAERAGQVVGPLFENIPDEHEQQSDVPLRPMTTEERLVADYGTTGLTLGPHPMAYHRKELNHDGITPAAELRRVEDGTYARIAGAVIARQRPGTASGFIFLSLEDETGISNAIIHPTLYERNRITVTRGKFLRVDGTLQNQDGVINVRASAVHMLTLSEADMRSHDFQYIMHELHDVLAEQSLCRAVKPANEFSTTFPQIRASLLSNPSP